jgi:hypothetical protein
MNRRYPARASDLQTAYSPVDATMSVADTFQLERNVPPQVRLTAVK